MLLLLFQAPGVVAATGIASGEAWGTPSLQADTTVSPAGIASGESWGAASVGIEVSASGISSGESWGTASVGIEVSASGISSGEAWGAPVVSITGVSVLPTAIPSAESWGSPQVGPPITNRVWSLIGGYEVRWKTVFPDTLGSSYPGPGVFGVDTADYVLDDPKNVS